VLEQFKCLHTLGVSTALLSNLDLRSVISKGAGQLRHLSINFVLKGWTSQGHGRTSTLLEDLNANCPNLQSLRLAGESYSPYAFPVIEDANLLTFLNNAKEVRSLSPSLTEFFVLCFRRFRNFVQLERLELTSHVLKLSLAFFEKLADWYAVGQNFLQWTM
jgi:hypothetical protein